MKRGFADIATTVDQLSGRPLTFVVALLMIAAWAVTGPLFGFSDTWQLVINTSTSIITFLMVFVIQNTQNRDGAAIQAKLDELIRVSAARNTLIGIETLTEDEIEAIKLAGRLPSPALRARASSISSFLVAGLIIPPQIVAALLSAPSTRRAGSEGQQCLATERLQLFARRLPRPLPPTPPWSFPRQIGECHQFAQ